MYTPVILQARVKPLRSNKLTLLPSAAGTRKCMAIDALVVIHLAPYFAPHLAPHLLLQLAL